MIEIDIYHLTPPQTASHSPPIASLRKLGMGAGIQDEYRQ